ncbi:MAG: DUF3343 domain-containing protein [Clostridia bacterium]|nr:DUF3343 domain-containing protein [Clostridia bacterium]
MSGYIATFHTHLAALLTSRSLSDRGVKAQMMPVPRALSSSCGTCVRYEAEEPCFDAMDEDVECVYAIGGTDTYTLLLEKE